MVRFLLTSTALITLLAATPAYALTQDDINGLMAAMEREPNNLDYYFKYAKLAESMGEWDKAAQAYETMLSRDASLDRVRLDLSVAYMQLQRSQEAEELLKTVLTRNPPKPVQDNINKLLAQIEKAKQTHQLTFFVSAGVNGDTNANSAPGSDNVTIIDISIPLDDSSRSQEDYSVFAVAGLQHSYIPNPLSKEAHWGWKSGLMAYTSKQADLDQLDLSLFNVETGPTLILPEAKMNIDLSGSVSEIILDSDSYLTMYGGTLSAMKMLSPKWGIEPSLTYEYRDYHNSPTITTYEDRTGPAYQASVTLRYLATQQDMFDLTATLRQENADKDFFSNDQVAASLGYTHLWESGIFANGRLSYRASNYEDADPIISVKTREDRERSASVTLGKNFKNNVTMAIAYTYRDVMSNIQNYDYGNHRISANVGYHF